MGGVHKLNEINSLTQLHIISHKTVEIIKMKKLCGCLELASSHDSMVDTTCTMSMHSQDRSLLTNIVNWQQYKFNFGIYLIFVCFF